MELDDNIRGNFGVLCSLRECKNGIIRINLDDVLNTSKSELGKWEHKALVTWKDYDIANFEKLELTEREYADFGHYIMARLVAIKKTQAK